VYYASRFPLISCQPRLGTQPPAGGLGDTQAVTAPVGATRAGPRAVTPLSVSLTQSNRKARPGAQSYSPSHGDWGRAKPAAPSRAGPGSGPDSRRSPRRRARLNARRPAPATHWLWQSESDRDCQFATGSACHGRPSPSQQEVLAVRSAAVITACLPGGGPGLQLLGSNLEWVNINNIKIWNPSHLASDKILVRQNRKNLKIQKFQKFASLYY
jgi:hypothetical protein